MSNSAKSSMPPAKATNRLSVACAACRYKHHRCDGRKPACFRCVASARECTYLPSRRRGNPKPRHPPMSSPEESNGDLAPSVFQEHPSGRIPQDDTPNSDLLNLYYDYFHAAHPCVLPRLYLDLFLGRDALQPLFRVICYIGSLFSVSISSEELKADVQTALTGIRTRERPITGFDVQAVLLYSVAVYWSNEPEHGTALLDEAIQMAVEIGMNRKEFATQHGDNNPVLEESWRRTWWLFYITDAHIAGSTHVFPFRTSSIDKTVDLPCEEHEYELGNIPPAKSLEEYDNREFFPDDELQFSSYAELIGLTRGIERALSPGNTLDVQLYTSMCANADTSVMAWHSLLPPFKRRLIHDDGSVDEVMFKAHFIMHAYTIEMHRPLSTLAYSPIEAVARCAPLAPSDRLRCPNRAESELHTVKCLSAIHTLDQFLTLPTDLHTHSPFLICMIANATIAHLSGCRFLHQGEKLATSREKIRLTMGTLKRLGEYWPLGKRTYQELGIIAREILCLTGDSAPVPANMSTTISQPEYPSINFVSPDSLFDGNLDFSALFDLQSPGLLGAMQPSAG